MAQESHTPAEVSPQEVVARSVGGAAATSLVGLLARGAGLVTTVVVTYFVSREEYGNANLAMIVATVANTVTLLSPQQALLTRHDRFPEALGLVRWFSAWSGVVVAGLLLVGGRGLLGALHQPEATPILWGFCVAMLLERLATVPALQLNYALRFSDLARLEIYANLAYMITTIASAAAGLGGFSLAAGAIARQGTRLLVLVVLLGPGVWPARPQWGQAERQLARELLHYSLPVHLGAVGEFLTLYLDNVLVGLLYGAAAQGLYVVGFTLAMTPCDTIAMQGAVALVRALGLKDEAARRRTYLASLRYMSMLLFPIAAITAVVAGTLQQALLPPRWRDIAPIAVSLSAGAMSMGAMRLAFAHLTAIHRPRLAAAVEVLRLLLFVAALGAVTLLDPGHRHLPWIGWGVSVAFALSAAIALLTSLRADGLRPRQGLAALAPPAAGALAAALLLQLFRIGLRRLGVAPSPGRLCAELVAGVLLYAAYLRLFHSEMYHETRSWLMAQLRKRRG